MNRYPILNICARAEGHEIQHRLLREYCRNFSEWEDLLVQAEKEGMAPLVKKHLDESGSGYPAAVRRSLNLLCKRHHHQATVRFKALQEILECFGQNGLTPIVIKGAALCYTTYPAPALRPMRDIDLLFSDNEVGRAQELMRNSGFTQSKSPIPPDHYHLPPLNTKIEDVNVCVELHRGLYPDCPPYFPEVDFEKLLLTAKPFNIGDMNALTLNHEETLHYIYLHAFRAPLTYEAYRLINAADIISFTEKHIKAIDWDKIKKNFPLLCKALPLMHHISPWNYKKTSGKFAPPRDNSMRLEPLPFCGWPQKRRKEFKAKARGLHHILRDTFMPSRWWVGVYYGETTKRGRLRCLLNTHPRHIAWWFKLYKNLTRES